jgi:hypothetical protein
MNAKEKLKLECSTKFIVIAFRDLRTQSMEIDSKAAQIRLEMQVAFSCRKPDFPFKLLHSHKDFVRLPVSTSLSCPSSWLKSSFLTPREAFILKIA